MSEQSPEAGIGQGPYQPGRLSPRRPSPNDVAALVLRKTELRAEIAALAGQISEAVRLFDEGEARQLAELLSRHDAAIDAANAPDMDAARRQAEQQAREEGAARSVKRTTVPLSRHASAILQAEISRRLERGHCPPVELLTEYAIREAYENAS